MPASSTPRSSVSDSLSPQQAAHTLSWSAPPPERDDAELAEDAPGIEGDEGELTPALVRIVVVAGLGGLLFGYDTGVCSGALLQIGSALGGHPLTTAQETGIVVSALWGALGGSLLASRLADWKGRKPVVLGAAVLFALGALEQAAAQVYKEVILGRVLVGIGVGLASMVLPIYLAEISPPAYRGRIVGSLVVLITGGQVLAYIVTAAFFNVDGGWRWSFGLGAVPALVQLVLSFSMPESPRFQLRRGRVVGARKTLQLLHPHASPEAIQRRVDAIQAEVSSLPDDREAPGAKGGWSDRVRVQLGSLSWSSLSKGRLGALWHDRATRRALSVAVALQFFQQATGFNTIMYFSGTILAQTHLSQPAAFAIFVAVSNFLATLVALRLIDRVGRRALLLRTLLGMVSGMALLAFAFAFIPLAPEGADAADAADAAAAEGASPWAFVALAAMVIFCASYALGIGNVAWVVQAEVFNQDLRAIGNGLATAANWSGNLLVSSTFLYISKAFTPAGAFALFSLVSVGAWIFTYLFLPETKGLSLEEVRALFEQQVGLAPGSSAAAAGASGGNGAAERGQYHVVGEESEGDEGEGLLAREVEPGAVDERRGDDRRRREDVEGVV
ncbi:hypothetical protein JCM10449v2_005463 [Rhodotorula kratochvilovae]